MPRSEEKVWTIVVGGGTGQRFGRPKQYELLDDRRVIDHSRAVAAAVCDGVILVVPASDAGREDGVAGGATRSESVRNGLAAVPDDVDIICVHDAARPLATRDLFERVIEAVREGADAAIPGVPVADTIKLIEPAESSEQREPATSDVIGVVAATPDRSRLVAVQTPQAFRAARLRAGHASAVEATDDAALVEAAGGWVVVVAGEMANRKITDPDDLDWARGQVQIRSGRGESS